MVKDCSNHLIDCLLSQIKQASNWSISIIVVYAFPLICVAVAVCEPNGHRIYWLPGKAFEPSLRDAKSVHQDFSADIESMFISNGPGWLRARQRRQRLSQLKNDFQPRQYFWTEAAQSGAASIVLYEPSHL